MRVLVTAGPTREYLDDVRFLSNRSTGRMGDALARAALSRGHEVVLVRGPCPGPAPEGPEVVPVTSTADMLRACLGVWPRCDAVIMAAAPADFTPAARAPGKIKKASATDGMTLRLDPAPDILRALSEARRPGQRLVGFALEAERGEDEAARKLRDKGLDLIALNAPTNFAVTDGAEIQLIGPAGPVAGWRGSKDELAARIVEQLEALAGTAPPVADAG
jgi:phosphopantothenoylcysteine decarboxylase/phosphopantothenate--cysteine ligase